MVVEYIVIVASRATESMTVNSGGILALPMHVPFPTARTRSEHTLLRRTGV